MDNLISVLIRTKNREEALRRALESVRRQTHKPVEVVIVNDGKPLVEPIITDNFSAAVICETHAGGRSEAANIALKAASGQYCLFLDDDDEIEPEHLEYLKAGFCDDAELVAVYSQTKCVQANNYNEPLKVFDTRFDRNKLILENFLPIHSVLFRREAATGIRFSEALDIYEDWYFWLRLSQKGRFRKIDVTTAIYHLDHSGIGVQSDGSHFNDRKKFLKLAIPDLSEDELVFLHFSASQFYQEQQKNHELRLEIDALRRENNSLLGLISDINCLNRVVSHFVRSLRLIQRKLRQIYASQAIRFSPSRCIHLSCERSDKNE